MYSSREMIMTAHVARKLLSALWFTLVCDAVEDPFSEELMDNEEVLRWMAQISNEAYQLGFAPCTPTWPILQSL